jgi:hypothetical protein
MAPLRWPSQNTCVFHAPAVVSEIRYFTPWRLSLQWTVYVLWSTAGSRGTEICTHVIHQSPSWVSACYKTLVAAYVTSRKSVLWGVLQSEYSLSRDCGIGPSYWERGLVSEGKVSRSTALKPFASWDKYLAGTFMWHLTAVNQVQRIFSVKWLVRLISIFSLIHWSGRDWGGNYLYPFEVYPDWD